MQAVRDTEERRKQSHAVTFMHMQFVISQRTETLTDKQTHYTNTNI